MIDPPLRYDFDSVANTYDQWYETAEGKIYDRLEKKAVSKYLPQNVLGMKLLEIGCGTGHWSQFFTSLGFEVTAIDVSESMIKIARSKALSNVSFQIADGHAMPFSDNSFDVTVAMTTLEFVDNVESVLKEMLRCTHKPGGCLLMGVLNGLAPINRRRQKNPESLYAKARWFTPRQLKTLLRPLGRVQVLSAAFVPRWKPLLQWSPLIDGIGRRLHVPYGAFLIAKVST